ncbi:MAG: hypothetical protein ACTSRG_15345 [Candidatus Helarchaeota archaeon]
MKIKESFVLAWIYILISIILGAILLIILIPSKMEPLPFYFFIIGLSTYITAGICLLYGTYFDSEQFMKYGLLIGICSWSFLILSGVFQFIINNEIIQFWHLINTLESAKLINPIVDIDLPTYIISEILYGQNVNNVIYSLGIIIITIIGCLLGVFTFQKKSSEQEKI